MAEFFLFHFHPNSHPSFHPQYLCIIRTILLVRCYSNHHTASQQQPCMQWMEKWMDEFCSAVVPFFQFLSDSLRTRFNRIFLSFHFFPIQKISRVLLWSRESESECILHVHPPPSVLASWCWSAANLVERILGWALLVSILLHPVREDLFFFYQGAAWKWVFSLISDFTRVTHMQSNEAHVNYHHHHHLHYYQLVSCPADSGELVCSYIPISCLRVWLDHACCSLHPNGHLGFASISSSTPAISSVLLMHIHPRNEKLSHFNWSPASHPPCLQGGK